MNVMRPPSKSLLFGSRDYTDVSRAVGELQARRPIRIDTTGEALLVLPVEGLDDQRLIEFEDLSRPAELDLIVTQQRAHALGIRSPTPLSVTLSEMNTTSILDLATAAKMRCTAETRPATPAGVAAIQLVKLSRGLPSVLAADVRGRVHGLNAPIVAVDADAVDRFAVEAATRLTIASEASLPLASGVTSRFVVFRDATGIDQVAIIVGKPDFAQPIPVRLHSACLTGDVFGSRRCDCGDQLRLALNQLKNLGGGVVLYLAQEGRGLGLANKMRAYQLQDRGLDTCDANTTLGFDDDERDYGIAALMLKQLNCSRILLLTNNPSKLDGLTSAGIEIAARVPLEAPVTSHNKRYLTTKAVRSGHRLSI
jgi:GTP cyclohydrolase II